MPGAEHGSWFEFEDRHGRGWCQVDLLLPRLPSVVVLEAKYSWVAEGHSQIELLYKPVIELALGKSVLGLVVCRRLVPAMPSSIVVTGDFNQAIAAASAGKRVVWHWLGVSGLAPRKGARVKSHRIALSPEALGL